MSTLGGSRGERNAKPKYQALDINNLYRTSRGESLEPSAQKNVVERKHGMQVLGKVPSARRPPANLPSLKAESSSTTSSPSVAASAAAAAAQDQSGSWPAATSNVNSNQAASGRDRSSGDYHHQQQQNYQSRSLANSGANTHNNNNNNNNSNSNSNSNNNNSSATWSSVTSAHEPVVPKPLLYQSPQFQHEFPSLDGSNAQVQSKGNRGGQSGNANSSDPHSHSHTNNNQNANANIAADTQLEQNCTQNDAHAEQTSATHQSIGGGSSSTAAPVLQQVVPPQFRALMPQFMHRMSGFDNIQTETEPHQQQQQQHHPQIGGPRDNRRNYGGRSDGRDQQYQSYNRNSRDRNDYRGRGPPPHRSNRHDPNQYDDFDTGYQSIIKEEELDHIDKIVKEEGWVQDDEIDYNQKLVFSDDDSDTPPPPTRGKEAKRVNFNDRDKETKARKDEQESRMAYNRELEREKLDRENNERNEREKSEAVRMQQPNGHRSGAPVVDADLLERVKQRKEEEEKRAQERRMAAAKKLQELEQKINKKKEMSAENENSDSNAPTSGAPKTETNESPRTNDRYLNRSDDGGVSSSKPRDGKDPREYGSQRYESKFDRDARDVRDPRDARDTRDARGAANSGDAFFNKPYQSNLPPRFQKQRDQQERHPYKNEPPHRAGPPRDQIRRPNQQSMQQPHIMKRNVDDTRDSKSPGYYKGSGPYSTHSKTSSSGLCESEDDDRVSSGRESISRSSVGERQSHLARSTSDSSQPEIKDKIGSWADEMELDMKPQPQRQISSTSSTSANDDIQPKQILQRVRKVSIESRSDKEKSEEREILSLNTSIKSLNQSQEDVAKQQFGTSPSTIEAPKSWGDSAPTTPEIARKSTENLSDSSSITAKTTDTEKKQLESVLENETTVGHVAEHGEKKLDDKINVSPAKPIRSHTSGHPKDTYNSDDGKYGKRPNPRGIRNDSRGGPTRNYGGGSSYRGGSSWNNRRNRRYNDYSESDGSDDEYHGHGNRGKDDRYKHDSSMRRDGTQSHSSSKDVFVPRGEPSRRGRGGGRTSGPIVKRIDNYGPPNAKSPFGQSEEKSDSKSEVSTEEKIIKKHESQSADENASHADSSDPKVVKVDDKKAPLTKPSFSGPPPAAQRKDSTGQKVESQSISKSEDPSKVATAIASQAPQPQRSEKTPPFVSSEKSQHSGINQAMVGSKPSDKPIAPKKDDSSYSHSSRNSAAPINRGKPQVNAQSTAKSASQPIPAKPVGSSTKPPSNISQSQAPVNTSSAIGSGSAVARGQPPANKMAPRFVKQPRDRTGSNSSSTWEKSDMPHMAVDTNEPDFTQRSNSNIQSVDKLSQEAGNKSDSIKSTIIFENTNFKSMPGPIKRQTAPPNQQQQQQQIPQQQQQQQQMPGAPQQTQRGGVGQYDQVQPNNLGGHHSHHSQNQHHLDNKKADDVFKNAASGGNFQDMLDSQQQMQSQVQRSHPSQTDVISSALQTMSFPKTDAEYEKDLKLAFTFESEILNDTQSNEKTSKGGLCSIPPPRSSAIHSVATGQNTISPSIADLSKKITSVKKVWETVPTMPTVIEHGNSSSNSGNNDDSHLSSTFVSTQNQQHMHQFTHSQQQLHQSGLASYSNSFGPDPNSLDHFSKSSGQDGDMDNVGYNPSPQHMVAGNNNAHQNAAMKHNDPLSATVNVCKVKPNQPPMHQSSLGLSPPPMQQAGIQTAPQPYYQPSQFGGMSAIPSPPAVLYNSTPMPSQYGHYERYIASAHYGAAGNTAPYNAPYMQSGPNLQAAPAPDMYQNMTSQYRMSGAMNQPPYNQQQQLNNQSTVLISSSSNSLMSATVKPTSQIGAIGTKVNAAGQTPYAQQYMGMYAPQQPPPQNSSYNNYNNSYFGAPNANFGIQATGIFGPQAQPPSNASMNQQPVANYGNFLINQRYQSQQSSGYSQQQPSSRSQQQQQQNPNQSQSQPQSGQQSQQQSNSNSQSQSGPPQSHAQDSVSNSFFK